MLWDGERSHRVVVGIPVDGCKDVWIPVVAVSEIFLDDRLAGGIE
jgi:hypothetical protein